MASLLQVGAVDPETPVASAGVASDTADPELLLAAFVGARWDSHYGHSFALLRASRAPLRGSWNWAAALVPFWLASRRLWLHQLLVPVIGLGLYSALVGLGIGWPAAGGLGSLAASALKGYWADRWLLAEAQRAVRGVAPEGGADAPALARIGKRGGVSLWRALVVPLALVAAFVLLAPPSSYRDTRQKAYVAQMKCELRDLADSEATYFRDHHTYSAGPAGPPPAAGGAGPRRSLCALDYSGSSGVAVAVGVATDSGWNATATHAALPGARCAIFVGTAPAVAPATIEGEVMCTR